MTVENRNEGYSLASQYLSEFSKNNISFSSKPCPYHDYDALKPVIMSTWQNELQGECPNTDSILVETQAVQESVQIPGTGLYLVYHSSR